MFNVILDNFLKAKADTRGLFFINHRGLEYLNNAIATNKDVSKYEVQKEKYHLCSNLALTECQ